MNYDSAVMCSWCTVKKIIRSLLKVLSRVHVDYQLADIALIQKNLFKIIFIQFNALSRIGETQINIFGHINSEKI